ncbi:hypothetical protein G5V58_03985 [Nocardioides anomalus]|uniref:Uncharacterized protein n=1 Tax=Nocardioides anomalus TaxID=2712223 RepID=A0A6G6W9Y9_9ACTN|nr:hypothetical protein [Nocardioides anomalus]QIG42042.1 hypothetical protein G5V58_03985 [Nocardioides anomalus]
MSARGEVADFWDEVLRLWIAGEDHQIAELPAWFASYKGTGVGSLDLSTYPDPYVGDLRGGTHDVKIIALGLNPGTGYPQLQGPQGTWTGRIAEQGYGHCFERSPAEDPDTWIALHGKPSLYWKNLTTFSRRWLGDDSVSVHNILNLELYPWHSNKLTAAITPPPELIEKYVWAPVQEADAEIVFAFGKPWFSVCDALELPEAASWGPGGEALPGSTVEGWRVVAYRLPSEQFVLVSAQPGYAGPPGPERTHVLRGLVEDLQAQWASTTPLSHMGDPSGNEPVPRAGQPDERHEAKILEVSERMRLVLEMVAVLHRRGYQRLRIVPGMSGSGLYWRVSITPSANVRPEPRLGGVDHVDDHKHLVAFWTNADEQVFGEELSAKATSSALADHFENQFPDVLAAARGSDWSYAGWYVEMLSHVDAGFYPVFYADDLTIEDELIPLIGAQQRTKPRLPLPPQPVDRADEARSSPWVKLS